MKYLFSDEGARVLESLTFTRTLFAFDFDGTLAPIVQLPEQAYARAKTERLLRNIADLVTVAVISGRSVADLKTRLSLRGNLLIGNHGLEGLGQENAGTARARGICQKWLAQIHRRWQSLEVEPGVAVEDKTFSLALHYRRSRNKRLSRLKLFGLVEGLDPPPRVILGKCVMNLLPTGGPHKGVALLEAMLKLGCKSAFYIGDDDTDEDVFALPSVPNQRIITVRVGRKPSSQAQFFLKRQSEIDRLLKSLIAAIQAQTAPTVGR